MNWSLFPNFEPQEFACRCGKCGGEVHMDEMFMYRLRSLRAVYDKPMIITSGYRCSLHPVKTPEHRAGKAADIKVFGRDARDLVSLAWDFPRIGIQQTGPKQNRFIHLGILEKGVPSPWIWSY